MSGNARELAELARRIAAATGRDDALNDRVARLLEGPSAPDPVPDYSGSVDECLALIERILPQWRWHVGHGANGILPYAALTRNGSKATAVRVEAESTTVPLALLGAVLKARIGEGAP